MVTCAEGQPEAPVRVGWTRAAAWVYPVAPAAWPTANTGELCGTPRSSLTQDPMPLSLV